jgi:hypothetical protein
VTHQAVVERADQDVGSGEAPRIHDQPDVWRLRGNATVQLYQFCTLAHGLQGESDRDRVASPEWGAEAVHQAG